MAGGLAYLIWPEQMVRTNQAFSVVFISLDVGVALSSG